MSSLVKTLRTWYWTVRGLMNSRVPISGFESPSRAGERKLHLRLDTRGAHHSTTRRLLDEILQQRRLAHARIASHHQDAALTRANIVDEPVEHVAFATPARQLPARPRIGVPVAISRPPTLRTIRPPPASCADHVLTERCMRVTWKPNHCVGSKMSW